MGIVHDAVHRYFKREISLDEYFAPIDTEQ